MVALVIEFSCVVAWFLWLHRRQVRDRDRARRVPRRQMQLVFEQGDEEN
jgi:hypothetical protein